MKTPVVSIVGKSNSGKTTFLEKVIVDLVARGYRVAAIKHNQGGFEIDKPGKDTWRMAQAGASAVAMAGVNQLAVIKKTNGEVELDEAIALLGDGYDIILAEGYKKGPAPKIEVFRNGVGNELVCREGDGLIAVVTDARPSTDAPLYGLDDARLVAGMIESRFLKR